MSDISFYVKAFIALLVLVNPLEGIPIFLSGTSKSTAQMQKAIAKRASIAVTIVLVLSLLFGNAMLRLFGLSIGAFQVGGGAVLFLIAIKMVFGSGAKAFAPPGGEVGLSFGIVPLAIPLMAGPGAITGAILYGTRTHSALATGVMLGVVLFVGLTTLGALRGAEKLAVYLKDTGITVATSVMGLIIAAISVEMMGTGVAMMFGLKLFGITSSF